MSWDVLNIIPSAGTPPTVFELVLQERLVAGFRPAFDHVVDNAVVPLVPRIGLPLARYKDEVWAAVHAIVEASYLRATRATVAENLYGLWRAPLPVADAAARPIGTRGLAAALAQIVLVPYVRHKLDTYYRRTLAFRASVPRNGDGAATVPASGPPAARGPRNDVVRAGGRWARAVAALRRFISWLQREARETFMVVWPTVHGGYQLLQFVFLWSYAFGRTRYHDPWMQAARLHMERMTPEHARLLKSRQDREAAAAVGAGAAADSTAGRMMSSFKAAQRVGVTSAKYGIVCAVLAFKLAEWWFSNEQSLQPVHPASAPVPPAPQPPVKHRGAIVQLPRRRGLCPMCRQPRANPAASSSGTVFCFKCLHPHVVEHGTCPVTGQPCAVAQIRTLYTASDV